MAAGPNGEKTRGGNKTPYAIAIAAIAELLPLMADDERPDQRGLDPAELRALLSEHSP
jgi:xanthine dehydrogenase accessory factor